MKRTPLQRKAPLKAAKINPSARRKARSKATKEHMSRVAELGCIACLIAGHPGTPAELHHPRANAGAGQRAPDIDVIPLCPAHHRGTCHPGVPSIHLSRMTFIATFGSEAELLGIVRTMLTARTLIDNRKTT